VQASLGRAVTLTAQGAPYELAEHRAQLGPARRGARSGYQQVRNLARLRVQEPRRAELEHALERRAVALVQAACQRVAQQRSCRRDGVAHEQHGDHAPQLCNFASYEATSPGF